MQKIKLALLLVIVQQAQAQDSTTNANVRINARSFIFPSALISYGFFSLANHEMKVLVDRPIRNEIREDCPHFHTTIDNYLQYSPTVAVYALNAIGIKGENNFRDRTIICLISNLTMAATVQTIKAITQVKRPDGFGRNAFPSGHTATAFAGAEFLRQEYKNVSPWYGIAGYTAATATGVLRMYNQRHWFMDVVAGAGFGMLSTRFAYWVYDPIKRKLQAHRYNARNFHPSSIF